MDDDTRRRDEVPAVTELGDAVRQLADALERIEGKVDALAKTVGAAYGLEDSIADVIEDTRATVDLLGYRLNHSLSWHVERWEHARAH